MKVQVFVWMLVHLCHLRAVPPPVVCDYEFAFLPADPLALVCGELVIELLKKTHPPQISPQSFIRRFQQRSTMRYIVCAA